MKDRGCFGRITVILGMQYGSEGKGAITSYLAPGCCLGVRIGAANAGHTIYHENRRFIMRQLPSVWVNPFAKLVIGVGAIISPDILYNEIREISKYAEIRNRLHIDWRAHVITPEQIEAEQSAELALVQRIGSTSATSREGIGTATADKVLRKSSCLQAKDVDWLKPYLCDTVGLINNFLDGDHLIILEGTQGFGLDLEQGYFPYVTSRNTSAAALAAGIGVAPHYFDFQVIGVVRTYPIRVAGNSGPFGDDSEELTWDEVGRRAGAKEPIIEMTSVTQKVRRVATFSDKEFIRACQVNRPTEIALTFADYL
ncbi:MAG: adenylosuccinate synthetase, partial [bacterium]|nr:adenylosuccinate synthetase [bacterium]